MKWYDTLFSAFNVLIHALFLQGVHSNTAILKGSAKRKAMARKRSKLLKSTTSHLKNNRLIDNKAESLLLPSCFRSADVSDDDLAAVTAANGEAAEDVEFAEDTVESNELRTSCHSISHIEASHPHLIKQVNLNRNIFTASKQHPTQQIHVPLEVSSHCIYCRYY